MTHGRLTLQRAAALAAGLLASTAGPAGSVPTIPGEILAEAARRTPVRDIDYGEDRCDVRVVDQWLRDLAGREARAIRWTGGACRLVGTGHDAGGRWCAQAAIELRRPTESGDRPMVEIFFEEPVAGRPGVAYAFRGAVRTADGDDMIRFRREFETAWVSRFPASAAAVVDCPSP